MPKLSGMASQDISQDQLAITRRKAHAQQQRAGGPGKRHVKSSAGSPMRPYWMSPGCHADLIKGTVPSWEIQKLNVTDLASTQDQYGGSSGAEEQKITITSGSLASVAPDHLMHQRRL